MTPDAFPATTGPPRTGAPAIQGLSDAALALDVMLARHDTPAGLAARQRRRLTALLAVAAQAPLYRPLLAGRDAAQLNLADLPVLNKQAWMARFEHGLTRPVATLAALQQFTANPAAIGRPFTSAAAPEGLVVWESSGSSGVPGIFVQDPPAMAVLDALEGLRRPPLQPLRRLFDPGLLSERIAFIGATEGHFASTVSLRRLQRLNPLLGARVHLLSFLQPMAALCAELQALQPSIVATYPSMALLLAEQQAGGRLQLAPREIWTGGETLGPAARAFVQRSFGCPVANSYGASEFLALASECRQGRLHLNSDWVLLEPVDAQGRPVPPGQFGHTTLLTNLANHLQPLIRYDLGDRCALPAARCGCGSALPLIEVQGRCDDLLRLGPDGPRQVAVAPLAVSTVLEEQAGLYDFQLVQQGPRTLQLSTAAEGPGAEATLARGREQLLAFLRQQGASGLRLRCVAGCAPQRGRSGKAQRVVNRCHDA